MRTEVFLAEDLGSTTSTHVPERVKDRERERREGEKRGRKEMEREREEEEGEWERDRKRERGRGRERKREERTKTKTGKGIASRPKRKFHQQKDFPLWHSDPCVFMEGISSLIPGAILIRVL